MCKRDRDKKSIKKRAHRPNSTRHFHLVNKKTNNTTNITSKTNNALQNRGKQVEKKQQTLANAFNFKRENLNDLAIVSTSVSFSFCHPLYVCIKSNHTHKQADSPSCIQQQRRRHRYECRYNTSASIWKSLQEQREREKKKQRRGNSTTQKSECRRATNAYTTFDNLSLLN